MSASQKVRSAPVLDVGAVYTFRHRGHRLTATVVDVGFRTSRGVGVRVSEAGRMKLLLVADIQRAQKLRDA